MPIRPENRSYATPLTDILMPDEYLAVTTMRETIGADPMRFYETWERIIARYLCGSLTPPRHPWDIDMPTGPRVEVKFSHQHHMAFRIGRRDVFRFASLRSAAESDIVVLVGMDPDDDVHLWVAPSSAVPRGGACTLLNPKLAVGNTRSRIAQYHVPFDALIPVCHLHYDLEHHAQTRQRARTAALEAQMDSLFETTEVTA